MNNRQPSLSQPSAEVSVGTPTNEPDVNDVLMNSNPPSNPSEVIDEVVHVTPRMDDADASSLDTAGINTSSKGPMRKAAGS